LQLRDAVGHDTTVDLSAGGNAGGSLTLRNPSGLSRAFLQGGGVHDGGELQLRDNTGANRLRLYGNAPGYIIDTPSGGGVDLYDLGGNRRLAMRGADGTLHLPQPNGNEGVFIAGQALGGSGGVVRVRQDDGDQGVMISGQDPEVSGGGGALGVYGATGQETIKLTGAETSTTGGQILLRQANRTNTIELDAEFGVGGGGILRLSRGNGQNTITRQADDANGEGHITTQVLEITAGSDLSENFDIQTADARPGMIVSIDPAHPGELAVSARAYDRTVAGVVSGAGGVKPGMLMSQRGSKADGKHPVALTGRVYCLVDASQGAIEPGDLITTSDTPGHGMKVTDHARAQGAIIGKAMTALPEGRGLVLVLVSLQ
jgi:hypothetical protein